jgi:CheY-like chemotaxis protein
MRTSDTEPIPETVVQASSPQVENKGHTVIIVDDDPDFRFQHETLFKTLDFNVLTADSKAAAEELLEHTQPDLAVVDLMMEDSDSGFTLCYEIKRRYPETSIVIVTSASSLTGYDFESLSGEQRTWIQADAVLTKPIRFDQITAEVNRLLDR